MKMKLWSIVALASAMFITSCGEEPATTAAATTADATTAAATTVETTTADETTVEATTVEETTSEETTVEETTVEETTGEDEKFTYTFTVENVTQTAFTHIYVFYMDGEVGVDVTPSWPGAELAENKYTVNYESEIELTTFTVILNDNAENQTGNMELTYEEGVTFYYVGHNTLSKDPTVIPDTYHYHMTLANVSDEVYTNIYAFYMRDETSVNILGDWPGAAFVENKFEFNFDIEDEISSFTVILNNQTDPENPTQTDNLTITYKEDSTIYYVGNNAISETETGEGKVEYTFTITNVSEETFDHIYVWSSKTNPVAWPGYEFKDNTATLQIQLEADVTEINVILNNQTAETQTKDMKFSYAKDVTMYYIGQGQLSTDKDAKPQEAVKYAVTLVDGTEKYTNAYMWIGGVNPLGAWPGTALVDHKLTVQLEAGEYGLIFNGDDVGQTDDLKFTVVDAAITVTWNGESLVVA